MRANITVTNYSNTNLSANTTYYYVVSAVNSAGESANSTQVNAMTPLPPPPSAPTGLTATPFSVSQIGLSWSASSGATSYNVKQATVNGGPYTTIATGVTSTNYSNSGLSANTTYYYVISAVNAGGESANSAQTSVSTAVSVAFEAESGTLGSGFAVSNSSSPIYITVTSAATGSNPGSSAKVATYSVIFPSAGTYQLYARIRVGAGMFNNDSLFFASSFGSKSATTTSDWVQANGLANVG